MIPKKTIWNLRKQDTNSMLDLAEYPLPDPIKTLLSNRGLTRKEDIDKFLNPKISDFYDPYLLKDMEIAVDRIQKSIKEQEKICIYGDYDVDGITSTSTLYLFLKHEMGADVQYYIPDRLEEGYGINKEALKSLAERDIKLVITVDTGITACDEVIYGKTLGLDMIITDHHECQEQIPDAIAVIDPKRKDCSYPFDMLAGVGVTFKLIHALALKNSHIKLDCIWKYLDIVAVGTVADIVPLIDENRIITYQAFRNIPNTWNVGLKALLKVSGFKEDSKMTAGFIGFRIGPRLNASGRMGDAKRGVELFTTESEETAIEIAEDLDRENVNRQEVEQTIYNEAVELIEKQANLDEEKILVVASHNWHHGVIGIVASKITERYYRPSILLCIEDGVATGSARSVEGFSIFNALQASKDLMNKFGGHEMAAGLSINEDKIQVLKEQLNTYASGTMNEDTLIPKLKADMALELETIDLNLIEMIGQLEPYGMGNPEPQFMVKGHIQDLKVIGQNQSHLKMNLKSTYKTVEGIGFNLAYFNSYFNKDHFIEVLCSLSINEWNGMKKPQMMIKDLRYEGIAVNHLKEYLSHYSKIKDEGYNKLKELFFTNEIEEQLNHRSFETFYRQLRHFEKLQRTYVSLFQLIDDGQISVIKCLRILVMLDVFKELEIVEYELDLPYFSFQLIKDKKVKLSDSLLFESVKEA
jgi:single-stranded-DNA-specific exonuclease